MLLHTYHSPCTVLEQPENCCSLHWPLITKKAVADWCDIGSPQSNSFCSRYTSFSPGSQQHRHCVGCKPSWQLSPLHWSNSPWTSMAGFPAKLCWWCNTNWSRRTRWSGLVYIKRLFTCLVRVSRYVTNSEPGWKQINQLGFYKTRQQAKACFTGWSLAHWTQGGEGQ